MRKAFLVVFLILAGSFSSFSREQKSMEENEEERVFLFTGIVDDLNIEVQDSYHKHIYYYHFKIFLGKQKKFENKVFLFQKHEFDIKEQYSAGERLIIQFPAWALLEYDGKKEIPLYKIEKTKDIYEKIAVFKKGTSLEKAEQWLDSMNAFFNEGMDSSKGKAYFYKTGPKFIVRFLSENDQIQFLKESKKNPDIYEVYQPDWKIQKD